MHKKTEADSLRSQIEALKNYSQALHQYHEGAITYAEFLMSVLANVPPPSNSPAEDFVYAPIVHATSMARVLERLAYQTDTSVAIDQEIGARRDNA
jgi:hypothetical protein